MSIIILAGLLAAPFIPAIIEHLVRKDKGPRKVPEKTICEDRVNSNLPRLERARVEARAKAASEVIRVVGDVSIPDGTEIRKHLVVHGNLKTGEKCHICGTVKALGNVEIGEYSIVEGHILSEGKIRIGRNSRVKGVVDSIKDIVLEQNAVVEAASTEKTVELRLGAKIRRRVGPGTLEEELELKRPSADGELRRGAAGAADIHPRSQAELHKPDATEERRTSSRQLNKRAPEEEVFEKLLASKMRKKLKKRIEVEPGQDPKSGQRAYDKGIVARMFLLLVLALSALLLVEVGYYAPGSVVFLETALPFGAEIWAVLLILPIGFGSAAGLYALRYLGRGEGRIKITAHNLISQDARIDELSAQARLGKIE